MAEEDQAAAPPHPHGHHHPPQDPKMVHDKKLLSSPPPRHGGVKSRRRGLCTFIAIFLILVAITALTLWLVYRPHKPKFRVVSAALYELNATSPPFISATLQFTVVTRNPNKRVSFLYDHLSTFVSYKNQAITPSVMLPPLFHETKTTVALSPLLGGAAVPVAAEVVNALAMEQDYGVVGLRLVMTGKLRYKAGGVMIRSRRYRVYVGCDLLVGFKRGFVGQLPLLQSPPCTVHL